MRILVVADLHCGHVAGLTPPKWRRHDGGKLEALERECWDWYASRVKGARPDLLVCNGDAVDGKGPKSGGVEQLTADMDAQVGMAEEALKLPAARTVVMTGGTPYHTGEADDWEAVLAKREGFAVASYSGHEFVDAGGVVISFRHHVGSSSIPHGRATAVSREWLWNALWAERGRQPRASIIVRSHVHYHAHAGGVGWLGLTTPALQAAATRLGRRCSGTVDFGVTWIEVDKRGGWSWRVETLAPRAEAARVLRLKATGARPSAKR